MQYVISPEDIGEELTYLLGVMIQLIELLDVMPLLNLKQFVMTGNVHLQM